MPALIRQERQILRAIQEHILARKRRIGAAYTQISTVGVVFHPEYADAEVNLVTPHHGVAWTRGDDLRQAFNLLERRDRIARFQFLRGLFPEAFARQLELHGLQKETEVPVWLYSPIQGPFPQDEKPFGRILNQDKFSNEFKITEVNTKTSMANWLRVHRSAAYGVEITDVDADEIAFHQEERLMGNNIYLIGTRHDTPIAVTQMILGTSAVEITEPEVIWPWEGMGFEEALIAFAIKLLFHRNRRLAYMLGTPTNDPKLYWRLGFTHFTEIATYIRA